MWKLLLVAAALCAVEARPDMEAFQANLTALWRQVQEMRENGTCRPQVRIMLDAHGRMPGGPPGRGRPGRGGPYDIEQEEVDIEDDMDDMDEEPGRPGRGRGPRGHGHHGDDGDVHVHLHVGGEGQLYNPGQTLHKVPWMPPHMAHLHSHARVVLMGGLMGRIEMRQEVGGSPLEMEFFVSGFEDGMENHAHAITAHWASAEDGDCSTLGRVFEPPHHGHGGRQRRPHDQEEHDRHHPSRATDGDHDQSSEEETGRPGVPPNGRDHVEGQIGVVYCDVIGEMTGHQNFRWVSIVGMHSIGGRGIAIHETEDPESPIIGCGNVRYVNGAHWGEADEWAPRENSGPRPHGHH